MMTTLDGLPAHVLLVHAVVVLVPLTALGLVLAAVWPAARHRLAIPTAVLGLVTLIAVPLTTEAGGWLARRVPRTPLVHAHTHLGDTMLPWAIGLFVVAAAVGVRQIVSDRRVSRARGLSAEAVVAAPRGDSPLGGLPVTLVIAVLALVVSVGSVVQVYRIGESGARAAWTGKFSQQALPGGTHAPHEDG
jgi:hypothetical protein